MSGNKTYTIYINSANRNSIEKPYDFNIMFDNDEIIVKQNESVNISVLSFSMLNSMYNVSSYINNNVFYITVNGVNSNITIPSGNYSVYTFRDQLNNLLSTKIQVSYNQPTNTYTYTNLTANTITINPLNCSKILGLSSTTNILTTGTNGNYVNMVYYQQVLLRCPTLVFENCMMDNILDKNCFIGVSDILFWINKQDIEPFKCINYNNQDGGNSFSYNILNKSFSSLNFKLINEFNQPIYDAPDFLIQLQISVFERDNTFYKEISLQILKLLNEIYYILLNFVSFLKK